MSSRSLPSRIGRYEVLDRLGKGGMGVLYLARDPLLRRTLAIKVLALDDDDLRERFAREARSAASLNHVNIVTIFDVGEDAGYPFLAMEYLDGETMAELIRRKAPLTLQRRLQLLIELCTGLGYAHRLGVVHRDIKPANLMVTGSGVLKILDFGLARVTQDTGGLTQSGALLGTPNYMSPEQVQGREVDQRSDIFSVGLVLYELLTYRKAYSGEGLHVILHKITHQRPQPLREVDPSIDPALERIVENATDPEPDRRYQSLELMAADTAAFLQAIAGRPDADATVIMRRGEPSDAPTGKSGAESGAKPTPRTPKVPNFEGIARRRQAQIQLHLDEAARHFEQGRYEESVEQCELAAVLNPEDSRALDLLSRAHAALEDQEIAGWLSEAHARLAEGALSRAEQLIQQSLERRPGHENAQALRQQVQSARREVEERRERERAVAGALERARARWSEGAFEAVVRAAGDALAFDPENAEAQSLKQQALDALEARRREIEHDERAATAVAAARGAALAGDLDGAAALLDAFAPPHAAVTAARAEVHAQLEARARLRAQASAAKAAARTAIDAGDWDAARLALEQAATAVPKDPELPGLRGALASRHAEAEAAARRQATVRQHVAEAGRLLADGDLARSLRAADLALELDPGNPAAQEVRSKAAAAVSERQAEEARAAAERVRQAREQADRDAREQAARETRAREAAEREAREAAERERQAARDRAKRDAAERAAREAAERAAREAAERERQAAADRAKRDAAERAAREAAEREARKAAERERQAAADRAKRDEAERAAREAAEREARDAAERERQAAADRAKRDAADRAAREAAERAERDAAERERQAAAERAKREAAERATREAAEREAREAAERKRQAAADRAKRDAAERAREAAEREAREAAERQRREAAERERRAREQAQQALQAREVEARARPAAETGKPSVAQTEIVRHSREAVHPPVTAPTPVSARQRRWAHVPMRWAATIVAVGAIAAVVVFFLLRHSRAGPVSPTTSDSAAVRTAADMLQDARRLISEGHADRALQLAAEGYRDTHDQRLLEFVSLARASAAKSASDAAAEASGTDAANRREYADADAKVRQAAALTSIEDAPRAVALYAAAEKDYRAAVTASSTDPAVFVRRATDAYKSGAVDRAVEYALIARRLDPAHTAADRLIDQIRRESARETARARSAAVSAGAGGTDAFGKAEQRARDASRATAPDDLGVQVTANKDATQLYRGAAAAAESARTERHAAAEQHAARARALLSQKRLEDAEAELGQATALEPQNAVAQAVAKQLADARLAARIASLLEQARGVDARQAIPLLEQAAGLDPSRQDVKGELQRRRDELNAASLPRPRPNPPPPPPSRETAPSEGSSREADAAAIHQVLDRYKSAWETLDVDAVQAVYPGVNAKALREQFKNVKGQPAMVIQAQPPEIDASRSSAIVRGHIASRITLKAGSPIRLDRDAVFRLTRSAGEWRIVGIDYR